MAMIGAAPEARLQFIKRSIELPCDLNSGPFYQIMPYQSLKFPRLQFPYLWVSFGCRRTKAL
jgi:hypothetical protein